MKRYEHDMEALAEHERKRSQQAGTFAILVDTVGWAKTYHPRGISAMFQTRKAATAWADEVPAQHHPRIYERDSNGRPLWKRVRPSLKPLAVRP